MTLEDMHFWYTIFNRACIAGHKSTSPGRMIAVMVCTLLRDAIEEEIHRTEKKLEDVLRDAVDEKLEDDRWLDPNDAGLDDIDRFPENRPETSVKAFEALLQVISAFDRYTAYKGQPTPSWDELVQGVNNARMLFRKGQV